MNTIQNTAEAFLGEESLIDKIEARIEEIFSLVNKDIISQGIKSKIPFDGVIKTNSNLNSEI